MPRDELRLPPEAVRPNGLHRPEQIRERLRRLQGREYPKSPEGRIEPEERHNLDRTRNCPERQNGIGGRDVPLLSKISQLSGARQTEAETQSSTPDALYCGVLAASTDIHQSEIGAFALWLD